MENHRLVRVLSVVVVPVQQRAGPPGSQNHGVHADQSGDVGFAGAGFESVAQHAHDRARHHAEVLFHRGPALHRRPCQLVLLHEAIHDHGETGHLLQRSGRHAGCLGVGLDRIQPALQGGIVALELLSPSKSFGQIQALHADTVGFQDFLAVAHREKGRRASPNLAEAGAPQPLHHPAGGGEVGQVLAELHGLGIHGVGRGQAVGDSVLPEVVAARHLPAETVPAVLDRHFLHVVGEGLDQDGHVQSGQADCVRHAPLIPEVGEADQNAVDFLPVLLEQLCALSGLSSGLHRAVGGVLRTQCNGLDSFLLEHFQDCGPALFAQFRREETAIPNDDAQCRVHRFVLACGIGVLLLLA